MLSVILAGFEEKMPEFEEMAMFEKNVAKHSSVKVQ